MKKIYLVAVIALYFSISDVCAQLIQFGATTTLSGPDTAMMDAHISIVNTGTNQINVKVKRVAPNLVAGHTTYFCWVNCYAPVDSVSPDSINLRAGDTTSVFHGYVNPHYHPGTSVVNYVFYDMANITDSVPVTYTYIFNPVGINETSNTPVVSSAYPNPADGLTSISYNLNSSKDARLIFYNMLGSAVKEIKLTEKQSTLIIATSDLKSGVYFYSLIADGKSVSSKKLVIAHH